MATSISPIQSIPCPTPVGISRTDRFRAVDRLDYPTEVQQALGGLDRSYVASAGARIEGIKLSPADAFVLSRLDARMTAREILQITPLSSETVERSLLRLVTAGAIEPATAKAAASPMFDQRASEAAAVLAAGTPAEVLGVPIGSNKHQVRRAYVALVRRFHPDAVVGAPPEVKSATDAAFLRLGAACEALLAAAERAEQAASPERIDRQVATKAPVAAPAPVEAPAPAREEDHESVLRQGEEKLLERPWEALAIAVRVAAETQGALRQRARLLHAQAQLRNPSTVRTGELELRAILHEDPTFVEASLALARLYTDLGLASRAASLLRRVQEIDPRNAAAAAALRALGVAGRVGA